MDPNGGLNTKGRKPFRTPCPLLSRSPLQPGDALGRPNVDRLFDLNAGHFLARLVEPQHGIVVHLEPLAVDLGLKHFRARNDIVPEDDLLAGSPELGASASNSRLGTRYFSIGSPSL